MLYSTADRSVYVSDGAKSEKIASYAGQVDLVGNDAYYIKENRDLITYNLETKEEKRLAQDVSAFNLLDDESDLVYTNEENSLFYIPEPGAESVRAASDYVFVHDVQKADGQLYYLEDETLIKADLSENISSEVLAEGVRYFRFDESGIVYSTADFGLYRLQDESSKRISADAADFALISGGLVYAARDRTLYEWDREEDTQTVLGHDVETYEVFPSGDVVYLTGESDLFQGDIKLASGVSSCSFYYDTLVYAEDDTLYMVKDGGETQVLQEDLADYSSVYYQNNQVYENRLEFTDLAGVWEVFDNGEIQFFEIKPSGEIIDLEDGSASLFRISHNSYSTLAASDGFDALEFKIDGGSVLMKKDGKELQLIESSREQVESYFGEKEAAAREEAEKERQRAEEEAERVAREVERTAREDAEIAEKEQASQVVRDFVLFLPEAVNNGIFLYISDYIDYSSPFYEEQSNFVKETHEKGIEEFLYDFQVVDVEMNNDGKVRVYTKEVFEIYNNHTGEESRSTYEAVYSLNNDSGRYLIDGLEIK